MRLILRPTLPYTAYSTAITEVEHFKLTEDTKYPGIVLCMRPANGRRRYIRRRYNVTSSLIGLAHTQKWLLSASPLGASYGHLLLAYIWRRLTVLEQDQPLKYTGRGTGTETFGVNNVQWPHVHTTKVSEWSSLSAFFRPSTLRST